MCAPEKPLVSVVTPCFNSIDYIEFCIQSVMDQDYPNVEHIIQDGASTDGTVDILARYTEYVDWVSEPDKGQSDGLNRALQRSRGDILVVLNADDEFLPHAVSWAVKHLARYPDAAVVYGDYFVIGPDGQIIKKGYGPHPYDYHKLVCVELVPPAQAAFIRRSYFEEVGFFADVTRSTCPDYEMWVRIGRKYPMVYEPGFVTRYRWHPGSEGQQDQIIDRMIISKQEVIDRFLSDPATPNEIRALRKRAYAGLYLWGAMMQITSPGGGVNILRYLWTGLASNPSPNNLLKALKLVKRWLFPSLILRRKYRRKMKYDI